MFLTREELIELSGGRRPSSICDFGGFCNAVERVLAGGLEDNAVGKADVR